MTSIPALTLYQPWASWCADGSKQYETRSWFPQTYRGPLAIHAGKNTEFVGKKTALPLGAIVAICRLDFVIPTQAKEWYKVTPDEEEKGDWTLGRYAWKLTDLQALAVPVPCAGHQKLWQVPPEIWTEVQKQI